MKKVLLGILIILLIAVIGFGGWYLIDTVNKEKSKVSELENKVAQMDSNKSNENLSNSNKITTNSNNSTNSSDYKKIYVGREWDKDDSIDMKLYKSSLGYEMYYTDDFKVSNSNNEDVYRFNENEECGLFVTKENISISQKLKSVAKYEMTKLDNGIEVAVENGKDEGIIFKRYYISNGDNITYIVEMDSSSSPEIQEGVMAIMYAMFNTFKIN